MDIRNDTDDFSIEMSVAIEKLEIAVKNFGGASGEIKLSGAVQIVSDTTWELQQMWTVLYEPGARQSRERIECMADMDIEPSGLVGEPAQEIAPEEDVSDPFDLAIKKLRLAGTLFFDSDTDKDDWPGICGIINDSIGQLKEIYAVLY